MKRSERLKEVLDLFEKSLLDAATILKVMSDEYKEPCKHEPEKFDTTGAVEGGHYDPSLPGYRFRTISILRNTRYGDKCIHCGAKIKATGWELA